MPDGRTEIYAIWRACERFGVCPPNVKQKWEDMDVETRSTLIAYNQIRESEDAKIQSGRNLGFF